MKDKNYCYGIHPILSLLKKNPHNLLELVIQDGRADKRIQEIIHLATVAEIPLRKLPRDQFEKIVPGVTHQGVIAICRETAGYLESDLEMMLDNITHHPFILILDGVTDPHNLGACLRTAESAGVDIVIAPKDNAVGLTAVVRKVASGAAEIIPYIQVTNLARTIRQLKERGIWIHGLAGEAEKSIFEVDLKGAIALVLGAEGKGLRQLTRSECDYLVKIPMRGTVGSLNVSVAAAVALFEVVRQSNL